MPTGQLLFFAIWLVAALCCGALIVFVWERLRAKFPAADVPAPPDAPTAGG